MSRQKKLLLLSNSNSFLKIAKPGSLHTRAFFINYVMEIKWRKYNRAIHRDLGYFFCVMTIIYGLSGIALNHIDTWNSNFSVISKNKNVPLPAQVDSIKNKDVFAIIKPFGEKTFVKTYRPEPQVLRVYIVGGHIDVNLRSGDARLEKTIRRPVFYQMNRMHYNKLKSGWTWFSDIFAGALIILAISGLFILKGKNGITRRGAWLTLAGLLIPIIFLILYL